MKQFNGYDEAKKQAQSSSSARLPEGGYVAKILGVRFEEGDPGKSDMIRVMFDIIEGEHEGFFKKQYDADDSSDKWWKGATTIWVPKDDGTKEDGWTKNTFAKWTDNFEKSNNGYEWDWDENKWKGLEIGLVFRSAGKVSKEGKEYVFTEVAFPIDTESIRSGNIPTAKFKAYKGYTGTQKNEEEKQNTPNDFVNVPGGVEEEVPF